MITGKLPALTQCCSLEDTLKLARVEGLIQINLAGNPDAVARSRVHIGLSL
jgi:hypothetical protein